ncbi:ATP-binding protein [Pseudomonadota bacterium]
MQVGVYSASALEEQQSIFVVGVISTLAGIIISILVGYRISRVITRPILELNATVSALTAGRLSTRIKEVSEGEIGTLEQGINNMAESLSDAQNVLLDKVNKATNDLNVTVSELEQRNIELERSRHQAEMLGEEKAQFLARMSHELRTPLNAVIGFSRLLGKKIGDEERREYAKTIINSATQLATVIDDVLTFSKLKSDSLILRDEKFSPKSACEDVVVMLSDAAHKKNIEMVLLADDDVPNLIDGDVVRVNQVLTNLISNAIKFTDKGDIIVSLKCESNTKGATLSMTVTDTGCGIRPENINDLFNDFSQVDNLTTRPSDGVGLGLSISQRLAGLMDGAITVKSEEGKGSCFSFTIPLLNPVFQDQSECLSSKLSGKNVLLFDQHKESRRSIEMMFRQYEMNVCAAGNDDVSTYFDKNNIDILVLAFSAEYVRTVESNDLIKEFAEVFDGPTLVLVGSNDCELPAVSEIDKLLCVSKPLRQDTLYQCILNLLLIDKDVIQGEQGGYLIQPWMEGEHVLVVEDNCFNQTLIRMMLEDRSAKVTVVDNVDDAVSAANDIKFDLILMDLHMPDGDGICLSSIIRDGEGLSSSAPIILVTADVLFDCELHIEKGVINEILHKPIHELALDQVLKKYCHGYIEGDPVDSDKAARSNGVGSTVTMLGNKLKDEVLRLCDEVAKGLEMGQIEYVRECVHQLLGVTGYYQLDDIKKSVVSLQKSIKTNNWDASMEKLKLIIESVSIE